MTTVLVLLGGYSEARAQVGVGVGASIDVETIVPTRIGSNYVYTVKWLCGDPSFSPITGGAPVGPLMVPGGYFTAINVYNPRNRAIEFTERAVMIFPRGLPGIPDRKGGTIVTEVLDANEGLAIDCRNIVNLLLPFDVLETPIFDGFVVIASPVQLNVIAAYTLEAIETFPSGAITVPLPGTGHERHR